MSSGAATMSKLPTAYADRLLPALRRAALARDSAERTDGQLLTAFLQLRDGDAFALLVRRHGPMVLGVARRVIGDPHAAEGAFQAVFLVLARRANVVRPREQVGNWLHGVAYRTAIKARMVLARRRSREKQVDVMPEPATMPPDSWSDLQPVIDAELERLPNKLRAPVVLCDLEGRPQRAVAKQLGLAPATLAARVAAARRLLSERLAKRGICLSGGALAMLLGERASAASVPHTLAETAVRAAEAVVSGTMATGLVSAHALHLSEGVMRMMMLAKWKAAGTAVLALALVVGGFGVATAAADEPQVQLTVAQPSPGTKPVPHPDDIYLRRTLLDLTGAAPTLLEYALFRADADTSKRTKVIDWLVADERTTESVAKRLGVPVGRLKLARSGADSFSVELFAEEQPVKVRLWWATATDQPQSLALLADREPTTTTALTWARVPQKLGLDSRTNHALTVIDDGQAALNSLAARFLGQTQNQEPNLEIYYAVLDVDAQKRADIEFLKQAVQSARGTPPTPLEERYFTEDKDAKKSEKLLDELLKDPATAKKLGEAWRKKMLEAHTLTATWRVQVQPQLATGAYLSHRLFLNTVPPDETATLVDSLIIAKKSDEQILEAITLAAARRLPTAEEKKTTLAVVASQADKKAAWIAIAKALTPKK